MTAPTPSLTYTGSWPGVAGVVVGSVPLAEVSKVSVHRDRDGFATVWLQGPLLKRDGTPGKHARCSRVDLAAEQPQWLEEIIADAQRRLRA